MASIFSYLANDGSPEDAAAAGFGGGGGLGLAGAGAGAGSGAGAADAALSRSPHVLPRILGSFFGDGDGVAGDAWGKSFRAGDCTAS